MNLHQGTLSAVIPLQEDQNIELFASQPFHFLISALFMLPFLQLFCALPEGSSLPMCCNTSFVFESGLRLRPNIAAVYVLYTGPHSSHC